MRQGDLVRLRTSRQLPSPWDQYQREGVVMRVRQVEPGRRKGSVCIQPLQAETRHLHRDWFEEAELEPLEKETRADFRELLKSYMKKKGDESI